MLGVALPPAGAVFHGTLPKLGAPIHVAEYAEGYRTATYLEREDPTVGRPAGRRYYTWQYGELESDWVQKALPDQPRALYRPENLERYPDYRIYILEREDMVDAFNALSGDAPVVATTCAGGCPAFEMGVWDDLYGREVCLWPTNTAESQTHMHALAGKLHKASCKVTVISPGKQPEGWTVLDAIDSGWTWEQCTEWIRDHSGAVTSNVTPIRPARLSSAPPVAAPLTKKTRQAPLQVRAYRDAWAQIPNLQMAPNGTPYSHLANVVAVIETFPERFADVWYDEFQGKVMAGPETNEERARAWSDADTSELTILLQTHAGLASVRSGLVEEAVDTIARRHRRHEVREWLESLEYDGEGLLLKAAELGWGCDLGDRYSQAVVRCFIMGAVARIVKPGCQVDNVPVFEGPGGARKTSSLRALFGLRWFDNPSAYMTDKDFLQNMRGKWCLELGELANIKGRPLESVKSIITRVEDTYRRSYGHFTESHPRQCVFAGTIDRGGWNQDEAGGRRWWPVKCGTINAEWINTHRAQLFAEAYERVSMGEKWWDVPADTARREQLARQEVHAWHDLIENMLGGFDEVTLPQVFRGALDMDKPKDWSEGEQRTVRRIMRSLGWQQFGGDRWMRPKD